MQWVVIAVVGLGALAGCTRPNYVECADDYTCRYIPGGVCEPNPATGSQWCAAPDTSCPSGLRWDDVAVGDALGGTCVAGTTPDAALDASLIDGSLIDAPDVPCEQMLAFVSDRTGVQNIWLTNPDGTGQRNLTPGGGTDDEHAWDSAGVRIAYARGTQGVMTALWVVNVDGSDNHAVTSAGYRDSQPSWAPDGTMLAFKRNRPGMSTSDIWRVAPNGTGLVMISTNAALSDQFPSWSPDGVRLAFKASATSTNIYLMNADGTNRANLTNDTGTTVNNGSLDRPQWSPDGTRLIFASNRSGNFDIWSVDSNGTNLRNLTQTADSESHPRWFPNGTRIAYARFGAQIQAWVMNDDGTGQMSLGVLAANDLDDPEVSPDGLQIAWSSFRDSNFEVYRANSNGTGIVRLTTATGTDGLARWRPCP